MIIFANLVGRDGADRRLCVVGLCVDFISAGRDLVDQCRYHNPIVRFIYAVTEPVLDPVRRRLPVFAAGVDLSPFVVWLAILFLQRFIVASLYDLAFSLR